jgi:pilus assembly protein CpaB
MFILAAVAFTVAIVVTLFTYRALRDRLQPTNDMTEIVVAAQPVALGARLSEADLRLSPWPRAVPMQGSFQRISDVVGRGVVVSMVPNEPILDSKLAASGAGAGLTATLPEGMRAVAVKVNDVIGVAGFVVPGSRVDVILSGSPRESTNVEMSKVILENVQVLAAGQNVSSDDNGKPLNVQVVTLLVTPEDSQKLALASVDGKIQLALRNPLDLDRANPDAIRREGLYGASTGASTVAPVAPVKPVAKVVTRRPTPPPAPVVVVAPPAPAPPAPPAKVELQLIQGSRSEKVVFDKKSDGSGNPGGKN